MRHDAARVCFFLSGLCSLVLLTGTKVWAQGAIAFLLGVACLIEVLTQPPSRPKVAPTVLFLVGALFVFLLVTLCPWPRAWANGVAPGQAALLSELSGVNPPFLHLTMAPVATRQALCMLLGAASVVWLSWRWSSSHAYRSAFSLLVVLLGGAAVALLAVKNPDAREHGWGVFTNRNRFSNYADLCSIFCLGVFLRNFFPGKEQSRHLLTGLLALGVSLLCAASSAATTSRGGLAALAAGMLAFVLFRSHGRRFGKSMKALVLVLMLGGALLLAYGRNSIKRVESLGNHQQFLSGEERLKIWRDGWVMSLAMQERGIGVGAFESVFPAFQNSVGERRPVYVENEYLETWIEWGVLGSLLWAVLGVWMLRKARHDLRRHPRDWQIGAWSALAALGVHSFVDFPLHLPANAWLACALLGMALAGKEGSVPHPRESKDSGLSSSSIHRSWFASSDEKKEFHIPHSALYTSFDSLALFFIGLVLFIVSIPALRSFEGSVFRQIENRLANGDFKTAFQESREIQKSWPYYWRAHYLTAYSAAGLPGKIPEARREFWNAQCLAQADPRISRQAGVFFFPRFSDIGIRFFDYALSVSNEPAPLFRTILAESKSRGGDILKLAPLALTKPERWRMVWEFLVEEKYPQETLGEWLAKGKIQWLNDPAQRTGIFGPLIEGHDAHSVVEAFLKHPPASDLERYWEARAKEEVENWEAAIRGYAELWKSLEGGVPYFKPVLDLTEANLQMAMLNPDDLDLQRKVAETLMSQSKYGDALHFWERLARHDPHDAEAAFGRAFCLDATENFRDAAAAWRGMVEAKIKFKM